MKLVSYAERPELLARRGELGAAWDEFMYHDAVAGEHWDRQYEEFPDLQLFLLDEDDRLLAESNAVPIPFGADELPDDGWDAALGQATADGAKAVSAIAITIGVEQRGKGLSRTMLAGMRDAVAARGLSDLVAPVRPSQKHVYPLAPMERYVEWRRDDGKLLDAWLRTHEQAGAELVKVAPTSMRISGSVGDWESWTGLRFPDSGAYVVPGALVPVEIDREARRGRLRRAERLDAPQGLGGQAHELAGPLDQAVAQQRLDGVAVDRGHRLRLVGDEAQQRRAALPERSLEARLLAQRLVAAPA